MQLAEKQELVRLLNLYQADLLAEMAQEGRDTTFQSWCQSRERFSAGTSQGSYRGKRNQGIYRQSSAHLHESCRHEGA